MAVKCQGASNYGKRYDYDLHCGMEYTIMLTDEEIRDLMAQREKFRGYGKIKNQGLREQKRREYLDLDKKIKEKLDLLNQR